MAAREQNDTMEARPAVELPRLDSARLARLAALTSRMASRVDGWAWRGVYERWRRGAPTTRFERKWLGLSLERLRAHASGTPLALDVRAIAKIKPLPERCR